MGSQDDLLSDDEELLIGISRPLSFQLPIDDAAPCAFFAGGSGIAPFRSFWQSRAGRSVGKNLLFLGVQSREKFCYETELRDYVNAGYMEVYTAFSRDTRGLDFDTYFRELVERETPPRYIDSVIVEQGSTVCDLVMSKKQGGLGGYLYVCGSLSVFDSVMSGIRKSIYNHRTMSMETTDVILDTAFAERRFMIDVFMSPKPLPCNIPTIPLSELALHTGHQDDSRIYIAVHGSVYDVTDFCPMHPGGVSIIKSNAGVDCTKSFDLLAHTNNPEVSSLLNKYFIGHLTPKPDYQSCEEISALYDLWRDYLFTSVETLVAEAFETHEFMGSNILWYQGSLFNMGGVRRFYHHQSRLLQGGFSSLFGAKIQELYLKLSFALANNSINSSGLSGSNNLPDVLGIIARAKGSQDAATTTNEVSSIGQFTSDSETARFHERGIVEYARNSIQINMELLEGIREEACRGMDSFDSVLQLEGLSYSQRLTALSTFLLQVIERMAIRLETFYTKLAQHSVYHPEMEHNPARTRWILLRRKIRDGSFFILTNDMAMGITPTTHFPQRSQGAVDFDQVISQVQRSITRAPVPSRQPLSVSEQHMARNQPSLTGVSAHESNENGHAMKRMNSFMSTNMRAIRRLSKLPSSGVSLEQLMNTYQPPVPEVPAAYKYPTPASSSRASSVASASTSRERSGRLPSPVGMRSLNSRTRSPSMGPTELPYNRHRPTGSTSSLNSVTRYNTPPPDHPLPPLPRSNTLPAMMGKMNKRQSPSSVPPSPALSSASAMERRKMSLGQSQMMSGRVSVASSVGSHARGLSSGSMSGPGLRALMLPERRVAPTF